MDKIRIGTSALSGAFFDCGFHNNRSTFRSERNKNS